MDLQRRTVEEQRQTLDELTRTRLAAGSMEKMMREIEWTPPPGAAAPVRPGAATPGRTTAEHTRHPTSPDVGV